MVYCRAIQVIAQQNRTNAREHVVSDRLWHAIQCGHTKTVGTVCGLETLIENTLTIGKKNDDGVDRCTFDWKQ